MNNQLVTLQQGALALADDERTRAAMDSISGGLTGGGFGNRISLRGNRFRFIVNGTDVGVHRESYLDVVLLAANPHVSRIYYAKQYDMNAKAEAPDCYSIDGKIADPDAPHRQNAEGGYKCMTCPQNVKGSSIRGDSKAKACAYKKRVIVVSPDAIDGDMYALDVNALSLFGTDAAAQNLYNLKSYIETLSTHQMMVVKLVTRLTFDDNSSVPKLFFSPIRILTPVEWEQAKLRVTEDTIQTMLADVINETEVGEIAPQNVAQTPAAAPQQPAAQMQVPAQPQQPAAPPAPAAQAQAPAPQMPPLPRPRGRQTAAPKAPAPSPAAQQATTNGNAGNGGSVVGFPKQQAQQPAVQHAAAPGAPAEGAPKSKGFTIDLDEFDQ